jgi:hypothetical protein
MNVGSIEAGFISILETNRWLVIPLLAQVAGFWYVLLRNFKFGRQVRCLHFCYCGISDWAIQKVTSVRDNYIEDHGHEFTPFELLDAEEEWQKLLKHHLDLQRRAGVRVPRDNHINYIMEDLTS